MADDTDAETDDAPRARRSRGSLLSHDKLVQLLLGGGMLVVAGVAGGSIAGFRVEPAECDECGKLLAACDARHELINDALAEAKAAVERLREECSP